MRNQCDCGATTEGKWANVHGKECASVLSPAEQIAEAVDFLERSAIRLCRAAEIDAPPSLYTGEAAFIRKRIAEIRAALGGLTPPPIR